MEETDNAAIHIPNAKWRRSTGGGAGFSETAVDPPERPSIFVPMKLHRRNGRKQVIIPMEADKKRHSVSLKEITPSILAIARAFRWRTKVESGEIGSYAVLARRLGLSTAYVARVMRLTLLAPDILEAIMTGQEPAGFSLDTIYRADFPGEWAAQRKQFGFPEPA